MLESMDRLWRLLRLARAQRETIDLSGFWHFRIDPEKKGESETQKRSVEIYYGTVRK